MSAYADLRARLASAPITARHKTKAWVTIDAQDRDAIDALLALAEAADFQCPAIVYHGPGHQSRSSCRRKSPHPIEGEHWAPDPMCPVFEWEGAEGHG